jgi:hypothetical protein
MPRKKEHPEQSDTSEEAPKTKSKKSKKEIKEEEDYESCEDIDDSFHPLKHSTASTKFSIIENGDMPIKFLEENLIKKVKPTDGAKYSTKYAKITKIGCNFGEVLMNGFTEKTPKRNYTNRGRKKVQGKNKRKVQGSGKYFNSQITIFVKLDLTSFKQKIYIDIKKRKVNYTIYEIDRHDKNEDGECRLLSCIYQVKIFRNGQGQIPGLKTENMKEVNRILVPVKNFFNGKMKKTLKITNFYRFIQNYKTSLIADMNYEIAKLRDFFMKQDNGSYPKKIYRVKSSTHSKLLVYFNTPIRIDKEKRTNLTIYRKGSVNIDGAINRYSANQILAYFEKILKEYKDFLFDPNKEPEEESSTSSTESSSEESSTDSSWSE